MDTLRPTSRADLPPPPPPPHPSRKNGRSLRLPIALAVVILLVAVAIVVGASSNDGTGPQRSETTASATSPSTSPSTTPVEIAAPDLIGLTLAEAEAAADAVGLDVSVVSREYTPAAKPGTIVSQYDPSGTSIGVAVAGPIPRVPDVVGMNRYNAARYLEKEGWKARETPRGVITADPRSWQRVQDQKPAAGTRADPAQTVVILNVAFPRPGVYVRVEGSGSALVTWGGLGTTRQATVSLPWEQKVPVNEDFVTIVAQRQSGGSGTITCLVIGDGEVWDRATSSGPYAVCTASA
jgi:PASTA domain